MTKRVLIADRSKPSVVIISEMLKDKYPDVSISIASTGREVLKCAKEIKLDLVVMEFFHDDIDGVEVAKRLKKLDARIPIIFTTFENEDFYDSYNKDLFYFQDCSSIQYKPIKTKQFEKVVDKYLQPGARVERRFNTNQPLSFKVKHRRTRRKKEWHGVMENMSLSGFCLSNIEESLVGTEETIEFDFHSLFKKKSKKGADFTIKGEILWVDKENGKCGGIIKTPTKKNHKEILSYLKEVMIQDTYNQAKAEFL